MSYFKSFLLACLGALMSITSASPACAQAVPTSVGIKATAGTYNFLIGNGSITADGVITTDSNGHATAITGLVNGTDPITGLSTYAGADNDLYVTGAWVTFGGLSFSTFSLGDFNFYNSGLGYYGILSSRIDVNGYPDGQIASASVAAVPEPGSWAMMLAGFVLAGAALRLQRRPTKLMQIA